MNELEVTINQKTAVIKTEATTIAEARQLLSQPIEVEAFGHQFFISLFGIGGQVLLSLKDQANNLLETEQYELKFG